jgi:uncharacterized protein (DUF169 family)
MDLQEAAVFIREDLRLKTLPVAVKFLQDQADFPEKARRPSIAMGKKIAICQGMTMARTYGWTIGLAKEDIICVPAAIAFGFTDAADPSAAIAGLFHEIGFSSSEDLAMKETSSMSRFENGEIKGIVLAPMEKATFEPDTGVIYGNPAQMMRMAQAWSYVTGERLTGEFGGKVECDEYLIAPFKKQCPRVVIPGNGERIFAATQDDEMALAFPIKCLADIVKGLKEAAKAIGVRYPVTPYQNFQPELPAAHVKLGKELGIL